MCRKSSEKRIVPFILTFTVGLLISNLFAPAKIPKQKYISFEHQTIDRKIFPVKRGKSKTCVSVEENWTFQKLSKNKTESPKAILRRKQNKAAAEKQKEIQAIGKEIEESEKEFENYSAPIDKQSWTRNLLYREKCY